jgi:hypothetical protein
MLKLPYTTPEPKFVGWCAACRQPCGRYVEEFMPTQNIPTGKDKIVSNCCGAEILQEAPEGAPCCDCGRELTAEEIHYHETRCNDCEGVWLDAIETWRHGGRNDYLDKEHNMTIAVKIQNVDSEVLYVDIAGEGRTVMFRPKEEGVLYVYSGHELTLRGDARKAVRRDTHDRRVGPQATRE